MSISPSLSHSKSEDVLTDEKLERVFREIEEASERRAMEEEEAAASQPNPLSPFVSALSNAELAKKRHRQSISISRVGSDQYPDVPAELHRTASSVVSPLPWSPPPLYRAHTHTSSTSSIATTLSFTSSHAQRHEEENHTTQKETIAGRRNTLTKAMSTALSKTLTRMRSRGAIDEVLPGEDALIIGVAVHEATVETTAVLTENAASSATTPAGEIAAAASPERNRDIQIGTGVLETSEPVSSRRMSITVSATATAEGSRSRSGSINKLRGKLPLRTHVSSSSTSADVKPLAKDALAVSGAGPSTGTGAERPALEGGVKNGGITNGNGKSSRRLSYFAKVIAQRLRRKKSGEEAEKDRGKSADQEKGKEKTEKAGKESEKRAHIPPGPILTNLQSADLDQPELDQPKLELSTVVPSPPSSAPESEASTPLSPSPRRIPLATEVPLPPSPSPCTSYTSFIPGTPIPVKGAKEIAEVSQEELEPTLIPLPTSPTRVAFMAPDLNIMERTSVREDPEDAVSDGTVLPTRTSVSGLDNNEGQRLPASALPDSDFGPMSACDSESEFEPMSETTPAHSSSPTESTSAAEPVLVQALEGERDSTNIIETTTEDPSTSTSAKL